MVNVNLLRSYIVRAGYNQKDVAKMLGMSEQTFTRKLKKRVFGTDEAAKQQKEADVKAFFNELTSGFGLDWLKFEQLNLKVTLTCTPKAMKAAITQTVTKIVRDCAALEENPDRDEIMVEYQRSLDLGSACRQARPRC